MVEYKEDNVIHMFGEDVFDDTVNIPQGEYEELLDDSVFLYFLKCAGVDSWDGWDDALKMYDDFNSSDD